MNRGLYTACSGMLVQQTKLDVTTNNLANVDTAGFKKRVSVTADFNAYLDRIEKISEDAETKLITVPPFTMNWKGRQTSGVLSLSALYSEDVMDTHVGVVKSTENPLDLTIDGEGFFAVSDNAGNTYYTRGGNFQLNAEGVIVTPNGLQLQGEGGAIEVGQARSVVVSREGRVVADGAVAGNIPLYRFENPTYLRHVGGNLLAPTEQSGEAQGVEGVRILSGAVESSNVSVVLEMVRMIEAQRTYEGASKALTTHDEQTGRLITAYSRG